MSEKSAEKVELVRSDKSKNDEIPHGTLSGYVHHKCSCMKCRSAQAAYHRERRQDEKDELEQLREVVRELKKKERDG